MSPEVADTLTALTNLADRYLQRGLRSHSGYWPSDTLGQEAQRFQQWSTRAYDAIRHMQMAVAAEKASHKLPAGWSGDPPDVEAEARYAPLWSGLKDLKLTDAEALEVLGKIVVLAGYHDDRFEERKCEHCEKLYRGPAVVCSHRCAIESA